MQTDARSSNPKVIVRLPALLEKTGVSRATAHRYRKSDPQFPQPVKLSTSDAQNAAVGYYQEDIDRWIQSRKKKASASEEDGAGE